MTNKKRSNMLVNMKRALHICTFWAFAGGAGALVAYVAVAGTTEKCIKHAKKIRL